MTEIDPASGEGGGGEGGEEGFGGKCHVSCPHCDHGRCDRAQGHYKSGSEHQCDKDATHTWGP